MVSLETTTHRVGDVTLVDCRLESDAPRRVRVVNRLAGPVWPPRRRGVPARGWDGDGVRVLVDGHAGVGYATPAPPADPPAEITTVEEPDTGSEGGSTFEAHVDATATPADVRGPREPRAPREATPTTGGPYRSDLTTTIGEAVPPARDER